MAVWIPGGIAVSEKDNGQSFIKFYDHDVLIRDLIWKKHADGRYGLYDQVKMEEIPITGMVQDDSIPKMTRLYSLDYLLRQQPGTQYIDTGYVPKKEG